MRLTFTAAALLASTAVASADTLHCSVFAPNGEQSSWTFSQTDDQYFETSYSGAGKVVTPQPGHEKPWNVTAINRGIDLRPVTTPGYAIHIDGRDGRTATLWHGSHILARGECIHLTEQAQAPAPVAPPTVQAAPLPTPEPDPLANHTFADFNSLWSESIAMLNRFGAPVTHECYADYCQYSQIYGEDDKYTSAFNMTLNNGVNLRTVCFGSHYTRRCVLSDGRIVDEQLQNGEWFTVRTIADHFER